MYLELPNPLLYMRNILLATLVFTTATLCAQLSWLQMPDFPGAGKHGVASCAINNKGYMGLGFDAGFAHSTDWYEYDPAGNTWTQKASLPAAGRSNCVCLAINNKVYVITGQSDASLLNETWEYDPATSTWTAKASLPGVARMNACGFAIGGKGYVGTGFISGAVTDDFYEFDPIANTWTSKAPFPTVRNREIGFSIGNKGYMGMGSDWNGVTNYTDFYEYNPTANNWTRKADFPFPSINLANTYSSSTHAYVLCGYWIQTSGIIHNPTNLFYKYNQATNAWSLEGSFWGAPRGFAGGFALNNDIYIGAGGGGNGTGSLKGPFYTDFWKLSNGLTVMLEPVAGNTDFKMFPNPANDVVFIDASLAEKTAQSLRIYDGTGRLISTRNLTNSLEVIDVSMLSSGMYFVELATTAGEVLDSRFVKQ